MACPGWTGDGRGREGWEGPRRNRRQTGPRRRVTRSAAEAVINRSGLRGRCPVVAPGQARAPREAAARRGTQSRRRRSTGAPRGSRPIRDPAARQPFTAPAPKPTIRCRWTNMNSTASGTVMSTAAAIMTPKVRKSSRDCTICDEQVDPGLVGDKCRPECHLAPARRRRQRGASPTAAAGSVGEHHLVDDVDDTV